MSYLARSLAKTVRKAAATFPVVLVTGARQTGKTTLLREEFGGTHRYVSLERPDVRDRAASDPVGFFRSHPAPVLLDEIQYAPDLLHYVKERVDADAHPPAGLIVHTAGFDGNVFRILDVWESEEDWVAFRDGRLADALKPMLEAGGGPPPVRESLYELHDIVTG